uniref:H15 domain-containing protein n=1 Tax=Anas platyrhynchos platyrhynchos TaxID=8840 RepID=U3IDU8_ANAPP
MGVFWCTWAPPCRRGDSADPTQHGTARHSTAQLRLGVLAESWVLTSTGAQHHDVHSVFAPLDASPSRKLLPLPLAGLPSSDTRRPSCSPGQIARGRRHPPTLNMVIEALRAQDGTKGASVVTIKRFILAKYPAVDPVRLKYLLKQALAKGLSRGDLVRPHNSSALGATGRFKVSGGCWAPSCRVGAEVLPNPTAVPCTAEEKPKATKQKPKAAKQKPLGPLPKGSQHLAQLWLTRTREGMMVTALWVLGQRGPERPQQARLRGRCLGKLRKLPQRRRGLKARQGNPRQPEVLARGSLRRRRHRLPCGQGGALGVPGLWQCSTVPL